MQADPSRTAMTIARNIAKNHGKGSLQELVDMILAEKTGREIADHFGISRERARQWKSALSINFHTTTMKPGALESRVAKNVFNKYGSDGLTTLVNMIMRQENGQVVANRFGVSRERARQWKDLLSQQESSVLIRQEVKSVLRETV